MPAGKVTKPGGKKSPSSPGKKSSGYFAKGDVVNEKNFELLWHTIKVMSGTDGHEPVSFLF